MPVIIMAIKIQYIEAKDFYDEYMEFLVDYPDLLSMGKTADLFFLNEMRMRMKLMSRLKLF